MQSTGFVLAPNGTMLTAVYFSAAIGRLVPEEAAHPWDRAYCPLCIDLYRARDYTEDF